MKLKYYLRGLAVGVILTTIILSIANADNKPMTDAQVRKRALELGMIESNALKLTDVGESTGMDEEETEEESRQLSSEQEPETESVQASSGSKDLTESEQVSSEQEPDTENVQASSESEVLTEISTTQELTSNETVVASETESLADVENSGATESTEPTDGEEVAFTIKSGDSSYSVSKALAAAGLVEDAVEFDNYLCNYGYSRKIRTGTYTLTKGMTHEEIAKTISG